MAKYKVLKRFKDKETKKVHEPTKEGNIIELTKTRGDQIIKKAGKAYLEAVEVEEPEQTEDAKAPEKPKETKDKK